MRWFVPWVIGLTCSLASGCARGPRADLVVVGRIRTMDPANPVAEAMAVREGRILYVGGEEAARALLGPGGRQVEAGSGHWVLPGMVDSHVHMMDGGLMLLACALKDHKTRETLFAEIAQYAAAHPELEWVLGSNWPLGLFEETGPRRDALDALISDRPAVFYGQDGHSAWLNSAALRAAGINAQTPDPPRGRIERDPATQEPTGTLREAAVDLIEARVPPPSPETMQRGLAAGQQWLHSFGITLIQDANVPPRNLEAYSAAAHSGLLTMKVVAAQATDPSRPASQVADLASLRRQFTHGRLTADSAKLFLDGVLEARTAALLEPYTDGSLGTLNWPAPELQAMVTALDAAGFQIHMHAIGDRAVREGLNALEAARRENGPPRRRHQMAHLELVAPEDIPRLRTLGVTANLQPFWMFLDPSTGDNTPGVVGPERMARLYELGSIRESGATVVAGSDWPVSTPNPFPAMAVGMSRQDPMNPGYPPWNPDQRVPISYLLEAYTIHGAAVNHREHDTGSLTAGKAADFIVVDRDVINAAPEAVATTRVLRTFVDGRPVFEATADPAAGRIAPWIRKHYSRLAGSCSCAKVPPRLSGRPPPPGQGLHTLR